MKATRLAAAAVCSVVIALGAAAPVMAGVKVFWPDQFKPYGTASISAAEDRASNSFRWLSATATGSASFIAPLKLKPGSRITRLSMSSYANSRSTLKAYIYRKTMEQSQGDKLAEIVLIDTMHPQTWHHDDSIDLPVIRKGYKYWVEIYISSEDAWVFGLKVSYR